MSTPDPVKLGPYDEAPYGCPTCRTVVNAARAGGCIDPWHSDNHRPADPRVSRFQAALSRLAAEGESEAVIIEDPETTAGVEAVRDWGEHTPAKGLERIRTEMPGLMPERLPTVLHGFKRVEPIDLSKARWATPAEQEAFDWGVAEGRRQATEERVRRHVANSDSQCRALSRLVGPWEPAEQSDLGEADWPGHQNFTLLPCIKIEGPHPKHTWSHRGEPCEGHVCPGDPPAEHLGTSHTPPVSSHTWEKDGTDQPEGGH